MRAVTAPTYSRAYLRYALGLMFVVYVVNFVDRQILSILLPGIKADLQLTDGQLGLLSGTAFGLFYATLGFPIARIADLHSRKWVMAVCVALIKVLGFLIAFALFTCFIVTVLYGRSLVRGLVVGAASSAVFYVLFPLALNVQLPVGFLGI